MSNYLEMAKVSTTPMSWVDFCSRFPQDCAFRSTKDKIIKLEEKSWKQIVAINDKVNSDIEPATDQELYGKIDFWTYPTNGKGDCEDYVLLKKKKLIEAGFPAEALLITIVKDDKNDGHAILTVRTDRGDFILDNQEDLVKVWHQTGYKFLKRQSPFNPNEWTLLQMGNS